MFIRAQLPDSRIYMYFGYKTRKPVPEILKGISSEPFGKSWTLCRNVAAPV